MEPKRNRLIATIGLSALFALPAAAIADHIDAPQGLAQGNTALQQPTQATNAQANVALQQPTQATKAPAPQRVSDEERQRWVPSSDQLNVPGNPGFGRVASK